MCSTTEFNIQFPLQVIELISASTCVELILLLQLQVALSENRKDTVMLIRENKESMSKLSFSFREPVLLSNSERLTYGIIFASNSVVRFTLGVVQYKTQTTDFRLQD